MSPFHSQYFLGVYILRMINLLVIKAFPVLYPTCNYRCQFPSPNAICPHIKLANRTSCRAAHGCILIYGFRIS